MINILQHTVVTTNGIGTSQTITLTKPTLARSLVVVMVDTSTSTLNSVTDNSPMGSSLYVSTGVTVTRGGSDRTTMWYSANSNPVATVITINISVAVSCIIWVYEIQTMNSKTPLMQVAGTTDGASTLTPVGPSVTTTDSLCLIVNVMVVANTVTSVNAPWTIGDISSGDADATLDTTYRGIGTYAPTYNVNVAGTFCSITASFREAPHSIDMRQTQIGQIKPSKIISDYYEG